MLRVLTSLAVIVAVSAFAAACGGTPTVPSGATFSTTDLKVGDGAAATATSTVTVNYTGWLYDASKTDQKGAQFDSSAGRGAFIFTLGTGSVIAGWEQGIPGIKVGGIRRIVIPPSLGYGSNRNGVIPPNSTLVFEVELVDVQ